MPNDNENDTNTGTPATEGTESISANGKPRYWFCACGGNDDDHWNDFYDAGIMAIGWDTYGNLANYDSKDDLREKQKLPRKSRKPGMAWNFYHEVKKGDIVFAKNGARDTAEIFGRGIVKGDYKFDKERERYLHTRKVDWKLFPGGKVKAVDLDLSSKVVPDSLYEIKYEENIQKLEALFNGTTVAQDVHNQDEADNQDKTKGYSEKEFLKEVFISTENYALLKSLLETKKNIILQGPPGVGKTFAARRLAWSILGKKDDSKIEFVQFHQNYSYEDFVMGYKPKKTGDGFELTPGVFYDFCDKVKADPDSKYFFIIDEINRGNVSKIFGELLMLLESDHRKDKVKLAYKKEELFSLPENLYVIGMMNTADRSLAMLDYALRRRFGFFEMKPAFDSKGFNKYQESIGNPAFTKLINAIKALNEKIAKDKSLGEDFCIGHSYFCNWKECTEGKMRNAVWCDILPLLKEYYFDKREARTECLSILKPTGLLPKEEADKLGAPEEKESDEGSEGNTGGDESQSSAESRVDSNGGDEN